MNRRTFMERSALAVGSLPLVPLLGCAEATAPPPPPLFKISIAPWSLMRGAYGRATPDDVPLFDYPTVARELGFEAIEHDNLHFPGDGPDEQALSRMKQRCDEAEVINTLILCGALGDVTDADAQKRKEAVAIYSEWVDAAQFLGCHGIRIACADPITIAPEEKMEYAVEGLGQLTAYAAQRNMNVWVENHNGYSSDPHWLTALIRQLNLPNSGIVADFSNWRLESNPDTFWPDPYEGIRILAPLAKSVSAKSTGFDADGNEVDTDFYRMMKMLTEAGFRGYAAVEYFGEQRREGSAATRLLLEHVREQLTMDNG